MNPLSDGLLPATSCASQCHMWHSPASNLTIFLFPSETLRGLAEFGGVPLLESETVHNRSMTDLGTEKGTLNTPATHCHTDTTTDFNGRLVAEANTKDSPLLRTPPTWPPSSLCDPIAASGSNMSTSTEGFPGRNLNSRRLAKTSFPLDNVLGMWSSSLQNSHGEEWVLYHSVIWSCTLTSVIPTGGRVGMHSSLTLTCSVRMPVLPSLLGRFRAIFHRHGGKLRSSLAVLP